jgi:protein involved in polysaccharide export with SLBB domain
MLFLIFIAAAVFWTGISVGVYMGRRQGPATSPAPSAGQVSGPTTRDPADAAAGALRPGDRIELRIDDAKGSRATSAQVTEVDPVGFVTVPVLGSLRAEHLTPEQLERAIAQQYKERNLVPPGPVRVARVSAKAATLPAGR